MYKYTNTNSPGKNNQIAKHKYIDGQTNIYTDAKNDTLIRKYTDGQTRIHKCTNTHLQICADTQTLKNPMPD